MRQCRFLFCDNEFEPGRLHNKQFCDPCCEEFGRVARRTLGGFFGDSHSNLRYRAKQKGKDFDLEVGDLIDLWPSDGCCPVYGKPFERGEGNQGDWSACVDRINSEEGYVKGNVQWISNLANRIKTNATEEQLLTFFKWMTSS